MYISISSITLSPNRFFLCRPPVNVRGGFPWRQVVLTNRLLWWMAPARRRSLAPAASREEAAELPSEGGFPLGIFGTKNVFVLDFDNLYVLVGCLNLFFSK